MAKSNRSEIIINSEEFYFKVTSFLQQNWALIELGEKVTVWFIQDGSGVFDKMEFETLDEAVFGLMRNGFKRHADPDKNYAEFIHPPRRPFFAFPRKIYSSGEYWREERVRRKPRDYGKENN